MAIVDKIRPETIEKLRGTIDFYLLRGILPVARTWPKKLKPPYTTLQAEAMEAFAIANGSMHELTDNILEVWRSGSFGKRASWTDVYRAIVMKYWKKYRGIPVIALDYEVIDLGDSIKVTWDVLQRNLWGDPGDLYYEMYSDPISKEVIEKSHDPVYLTLYNDDGIRLVAPYILIEV